jgi:hypothetical protein
MTMIPDAMARAPYLLSEQLLWPAMWKTPVEMLSNGDQVTGFGGIENHSKPASGSYRFCM